MLKYISLQNFITTILTKRKLNFWNYIVIIWPGVIYEIKVWWTSQSYKTKNNLLVLSVHFFFLVILIQMYCLTVPETFYFPNLMVIECWANGERTLSKRWTEFVERLWTVNDEQKQSEKWSAKWLVNAPWTICEPFVNARWTIYLEYPGS